MRGVCVAQVFIVSREPTSTALCVRLSRVGNFVGMMHILKKGTSCIIHLYIISALYRMQNTEKATRNRGIREAGKVSCLRQGVYVFQTTLATAPEF